MACTIRAGFTPEQLVGENIKNEGRCKSSVVEIVWQVQQKVTARGINIIEDELGFSLKRKDQVPIGERLADVYHFRQVLPSHAPCRVGQSARYLDVRLGSQPARNNTGFDYIILSANISS